ncbi:MAG: GAF domain-containing protein [Deltaproteobacteria bacterium]|nr:GAF domain-containing protein [Deltaproteobacteria bacterium]
MNANVQVLITIGASVVYLLIAIFVYAQNKSHPANRSFARLLLFVSIWQIDVAGIRGAPDPSFAELWGNLFRNGLLFIPPAFLHFALIFLHPQGFPGRARKILAVAYAVSLALVALNLQDYLMGAGRFTGPARRYPWGYSVQSGPLYTLFIVHFMACILITFYYLIRGFFRADKYQKHRIQYFFLALALGFLIGSINFLPMFGVAVYPFGNIGIIASLTVMSYTIVKHRLMDVSVFLAQGLGYALSLALILLPGGVLLVILEKTFFRRVDQGFSFLALLFGGGLAIVFLHMKGRVDRAMRRIIVRDKYSHHRVLEEFSRRLITIVDLNRLLHILAETVERHMGITRISIFLFDREKDLFWPALIRGGSEPAPAGTSRRSGEPGISRLLEKKEAVLRAELQRGGAEEKDVLALLDQLEAEVCLPLIFMNRPIGFINLGSKLGQEVYYREDLELLNSLAGQAAVAIENANLYENLKRSQAIMRRADRLASLGTLTASLAHEIRNPLVSIKTFTQLLPERIEDEEFRSYFLNIASGEIDRLASLVDGLLEFARPSEPRLKEEDGNALIDKIEFLIATEARKRNISLHKRYAHNLPPVRVDAEQIKQVLLNVLLNAIHAITGPGQIWIETRLVHVTEEDGLGRYMQIEVRDTGEGIPPENLERVFDPFFSTRPEGSGLGLAISHQIIHEHEGFIDVTSELGKGTSFRIHLPLEEGGTVEPGR